MGRAQPHADVGRPFAIGVPRVGSAAACACVFGWADRLVAFNFVIIIITYGLCRAARHKLVWFIIFIDIVKRKNVIYIEYNSYERRYVASTCDTSGRQHGAVLHANHDHRWCAGACCLEGPALGPKCRRTTLSLITVHEQSMFDPNLSHHLHLALGPWHFLAACALSGCAPHVIA